MATRASGLPGIGWLTGCTQLRPRAGLWLEPGPVPVGPVVDPVDPVVDPLVELVVPLPPPALPGALPGPAAPPLGPHSWPAVSSSAAEVTQAAGHRVAAGRVRLVHPVVRAGPGRCCRS